MLCVCVFKMSSQLPSLHIGAVIHTVAPVYGGMRDVGAPSREQLLRQCVTSVLDSAVVHGSDRQGCEQVAICGLGAGVFGWPALEAATEIVHAVAEWADRTGVVAPVGPAGTRSTWLVCPHVSVQCRT